MIILSILFFVTAILYSSVGFGGGSTYLALLLIWDIPYYIFPVIALLCNIIKWQICFCFTRFIWWRTDAWDRILKHQLDINHKPCNFVQLFPRLKEK